jgi:hypothetical protein
LDKDGGRTGPPPRGGPFPTRETWGGPTSEDEDRPKTLEIRLDPELYDRLKRETERLDTDEETFIWWCIRTGIYLEDLNTFIRSTSKEEFEL